MRINKLLPVIVLVRPQPQGFIGLVWQKRCGHGWKNCTTLHETEACTSLRFAAESAQKWADRNSLNVLRVQVSQ